MAGFNEIGGFDANKVEPSANVLPAGEYEAMIVDSKWEPTKKNDGSKFLKLKIQIVSGPMQNRILFDRLNLINRNEQAVQIAKGTLSAICRAVGVLTPEDSAQLHNRPMKLTVTCKSDPQHGPSNEIKGYKSRHVGGGAPALGAPPAQPAAQPYVPPAVSGQQTPW